MKINLGQLVNSRDAIVELLDLPLPSKVAYQMAKFQKKIEPETSAFDVARIKLLTPYANEEGLVNLESVPAKELETVNTELSELLSQEVEVEFDPLLDIEQLTSFWDRKDVAVKASSLLIADFLFKKL
jgi:hypothetical protein